ncbi:hypothetical protein IDJ77_22170 [Mucilaginibacter sp. ZT4R22]|uniref:Secreted protein n=1 Tax=Mucilaginibacter pankratovii TaxID=2772110 RepID=A0ABR7WW72_9SPHI|nr:hypothetical protein [Mucilaginibacter pankratovii]MBD1366537.1 hypothetical protein [Mucilaginibacter pankratovii]
MKRSTLILLTAIYLLSVVGIGVNRFYCCGKLTSIELTYAVTDHTDKDNCCKNDVKSFKVKDTHVNSTSFALSDLSPVILPSLSTWNVTIPVNEQIATIGYQSHAPPGHLPIPIYTLNCTYRI